MKGEQGHRHCDVALDYDLTSDNVRRGSSASGWHLAAGNGNREKQTDKSEE